MYTENVVWYQEQGTLKAWVHRVNDAYQYEIYETAHGMKKLLRKASEETLPFTKTAVFKYFAANQAGG